MKPFPAALLLAGVASLLTPCLTAQPAPAETIAALRTDWARNLHEKLVDASLAEYAPDAEFISTGQKPFHGSGAIHRLFKFMTATYDSDLIFHSDRVEVVGDRAFDTGTYDETMVNRSSAKAQKMTGTYLTVYRRENDAWLITEQFWTIAPGAAPPTLPTAALPAPPPAAAPRQ